MLSVNTVNNKAQYPNSFCGSSNIKGQKLEYKKDEVSFTKNKSAGNDDNSKVGFLEGAKLVLGGAGNRIKDMFLYPLKHPLISAAAGIVTTATMCALPLIGISSVTGAAVLGVGFAALSTLNMAKNIKNAVKSYKENNNNELRKNLKEIGGSCVDIALSTRTFKKNIINIKNQFKYGKIGFRKDFANDFKNQKGIMKKLSSLNKSNAKINGEINKIAGIDALQKELKFSDEIKREYLKLYDIKDDKEFINQAYKRLTTDLGYRNNSKNNSPVLIFDTSTGKNYVAAYDVYSNSVCVNLENIENCSKNEILSCLRHELQHFQQKIDIERTRGLGLEKLSMQGKEKNNIWALEELEKNANFDGMSSEDIEIYKNSFKSALKHNEAIFAKNPKKEFINGNWHSNFDDFDPCMFNAKDRHNLFTNIRNIAKEQGEIKPGTKAAKKAQKMYNGYLNYTTAPYRKDCKNYFDYIKRLYRYYFNYNETDAGKHQNVITPFTNDIRVDAAVGTIHSLNMLSMNK